MSADPADLADVAAHLLGVAHPDADQLEQRMLDDFGDTILPTKPVPQTTIGLVSMPTATRHPMSFTQPSSRLSRRNPQCSLTASDAS